MEDDDIYLRTYEGFKYTTLGLEVTLHYHNRPPRKCELIQYSHPGTTYPNTEIVSLESLEGVRKLYTPVSFFHR